MTMGVACVHIAGRSYRPIACRSYRPIAYRLSLCSEVIDACATPSKLKHEAHMQEPVPPAGQKHGVKKRHANHEYDTRMMNLMNNPASTLDSLTPSVAIWPKAIVAQAMWREGQLVFRVVAGEARRRGSSGSCCLWQLSEQGRLCANNLLSGAFVCSPTSHREWQTGRTSA